MGQGERENIHRHTLPDGTIVEHAHEHGHGHGHTHSHTQTKAVLNRLHPFVIMTDYAEVHTAVVKSAINNTGKVILQDHIEHCIVDAVEHGDTQALVELEKAIDRFIK